MPNIWKSFLVALLFLSMGAKAQELVVFSNDQKYEFAYALNTISSNETSDYFVQEIAKGLPRNPDLVKYSASFDVNSKIIKYPKDFYKIQIKIQNFSTQGHVSYRGFDLSAMIFPKAVNGKVVWKDVNTNARFEANLDFYQSNLFTDFLVWSKEIQDPSGNASFTIDTLYLDFHFESIQKEEFIQVVEDIDAYYDSGLLLDEIEEKIARINLENASMLMIYNIQLKSITKELKKMHPKHFYQNQQQLGYDPIGLGERYDGLMHTIDSLHKGIDTQVDVLDRSYYKQGMHALELGDTSNAKRLFLRSVNINPNYSLSFYQLAEIEMQRQVYDSAVFHIRTILVHLKPDYEVKKKTIKLASQCATLISQKALALTKEENFNDAVRNLDVALLLCDSTPYVECSEQVTRAMSEAKYGLYASYLSVARQALDYNLKMVEGYLDLAYRYQQNNQAFIISSAEVDNLYKQLLEKYKVKGEEYLRNNEFGYAISYSDKMTALCKRLPHLKCGKDAYVIKKNALTEIYRNMIKKSLKMMKDDGALSADMYLDDAIAFQKQNIEYITNTRGTDTILHRVKRDVYLQHIQKVAYYKKDGRDDLAVSHIRMAKDIEEEFPTFQSDKLEALVVELMVPVLLAELRYPNTETWGRHYRSAQSALDAVLRKKELYKINDDKLQKAIDETDYYIRITSCVDLKKDYKNQIRRANTHMQNGDYLNASKNWKKALTIAQKNRYCGLDTIGLLRYFDSYSPVIRFQKLKKEAESFYQTKQYEAAVQAYWKTQKIADSMDLKRYRLFHISFASWVDGKLQDEAFLNAMLVVLQAEKAFNPALSAWISYAKRAQTPKLNATQMQFLKAVAQDDVKSGKMYKDSSLKYFNTDKSLIIISNHYHYYYTHYEGKVLKAKLLRMRYKIN